MAGKDLRELHPSAIKVDITVTLQLLKSLSLVSGNTRRVHVLLGSAGRIAPTPAFGLFLLLEVLPTCVIVWPLSACLLQSAVLQQPSPPPSISHARSLPPCGPLQTSFPPLPSPFPPKSSSFRTGPPPCIESTTHYYYCYTRVCQQPPLPLSPPVSLLARITLSGDGVDWCFVLLYFPLLLFFFFFFIGVAGVHFNFVLLWEVCWYCCCYHERLLYLMISWFLCSVHLLSCPSHRRCLQGRTSV